MTFVLKVLPGRYGPGIVWLTQIFIMSMDLLYTHLKPHPESENQHRVTEEFVITGSNGNHEAISNSAR